MDFLSILGDHVGPVPVWLIVGVGAIGVAVFAPKLLSRFSGGSATTSANSGASTMPDMIDPVSGVEFSVETATDPSTGLPVYYSPVATGATSSTTTTGATLPPDPNATAKQTAISQWVAKNGKPWTGPAGSYPSGWIQPALPGAYIIGQGFTVPYNPTAGNPGGHGVAANHPYLPAAHWPFARAI